MKRHPVLALLVAAALPAACGGDEAPKPAPKPEPAKEAPKPAPEAAEPSGSGLDVSSLKGPGDPKPAEAPPAEAKPAPAPAKPAEPAKPAIPVPGHPDEITDKEVLASWAQDERDALKELVPADQEKEIQKRRLEIFRQRGGKLDESAAKPEEKPVEGPDGSRGPARPDAVKEKDLPPPALREILDDLASRDPEIRARGVEAARRFPEKSVAARHLVPLLEDKDPELRVIVCSTLGDLKQSDSVPALLKIIEKGDKDAVRAMALHALGDIGGPQARAALRDIVKEGSEPSDRATALGQLVKQREVGEVKDLLGKALDDLNADVRLQAVAAIREFNLKDFIKELYPRLEDASEQVITEAIRAFGAMNVRESVPALMKILLKPDPEAEDPEGLQEAANTALVAITGVNQGYADTLPDAQKAAAIDAWRAWWNKNKATWK